MILIGLLALVGVVLLGWVLWPVLGTAGKEVSAVLPEDVRRAELEEERDQLLGQLREAQDVSGSDDRASLRDKVRLAQILSELDTLPPAPHVVSRGQVSRWAWGAAVASVLLVCVGSLTVFPQWRLAGLPAREARELSAVVRLPTLAARAQRTGTLSDAQRWGETAWDAGRYREAAQAYTQVLTLDKTNAQAMRRAGFYLIGVPEMAVNGFGLLARSAAAEPNNPEAQLLYGYGLGVAGQYEEGLKVLRRYQTLAPESHEADDLLLEYTAKTGKAADGALVYAQNCAGCHGANLEGAKALALLGSPALKNEAALRSIIVNGTTAMPAFGHLKGDSLDALVRFLMAK